jgi:hypothetical protein
MFDIIKCSTIKRSTRLMFDKSNVRHSNVRHFNGKRNTYKEIRMKKDIRMHQTVSCGAADRLMHTYTALSKAAAIYFITKKA